MENPHVVLCGVQQLLVQKRRNKAYLISCLPGSVH
ncbi:hypothetical protein CsSME_00048598 [Camellia sinensis var. sinensis]